MLSEKEQLLYEAAWHDASRGFASIKAAFQVEHHRGHLSSPELARFNSLCQRLFSDEHSEAWKSEVNSKESHALRAGRLVGFIKPVVAEARKVSRLLPRDLHRASVNYGLVSLQALNEIASGELAGYLRKETVDLNELVGKEISGEPYQDKHGRQVVAETVLAESARAFGDRNALTRILMNLREDASIHPDSEDGIRLRFTTARTKTGHVVLRVVSRGGKPLSRKLMQKIGRVQFTTRKGADARVHGLGKISVRQLVERMGGGFRARNYRGSPALEIRLRAA